MYCFKNKENKYLVFRVTSEKEARKKRGSIFVYFFARSFDPNFGFLVVLHNVAWIKNWMDCFNKQFPNESVTAYKFTEQLIEPSLYAR